MAQEFKILDWDTILTPGAHTIVETAQRPQSPFHLLI